MAETKNVVVAISGGIAAYKAALVVRQLIKRGWQVRVMMTQTAAKFIAPLTLATLSKHEVLTDATWFAHDNVAHIEMVKWADAILVVPATANVIAQAAAGMATDVVSTVLLASSKPVFFVPAMNDGMWHNPATQANVALLRKRRAAVLDPAVGFLAEGYVAAGRMPEPQAVVAWFEQQMQPVPQLLANKRVVVTAGPTVEPIDPVRYLSNYSSGKMGYALAQAAAAMGAAVTLISGPTKLTPPAGAKVVNITTTADLLHASQTAFAQCDYFVMAAAVADYHVAHVADQKIKRAADTPLQLTLQPNPDIVATLGQAKTTQVLIGFAAETQDVIKNGQKKLEKKNLDMLVANDVSRSDIGFGADANQVTLLLPTKKIAVPKQSKANIARIIWQHASQLTPPKEAFDATSD